MAVGRADPVLVLCPVNVDETVARIRVVLLEPVQPKNPASNKVIRVGQRIVRGQRYASFENRAGRGPMSDFFRNPKISQWRFHTAFFHADAESRGGDWILTQHLAIARQRETLIGYRDVDLGPAAWRRRNGLTRRRCAFIYAALHG